MRLLRIPEPFDHPDWLFGLKLDGFRALAFIDGHRCRLVSRNGQTLEFPQLAEELAHTVQHQHAVLDGEIVCLDDDRPHFNELLFRRTAAWPVFYAFDVLRIDGRDLRRLPLEDRKRELRRIVPRKHSRLIYVEPFIGTDGRCIGKSAGVTSKG